MKVAFVPDFGRHNPYQNSLAKSLEPFGVSIIKGKQADVLHDIIFGRLKVDILHFHWLPPFKWKPIRLFKLTLFLLNLAALRLRGIKIVWTVHNLIPHESVSPKGDWLIAKITAKLANAIIVHSKTAQTKVISFFNLKNHKKIFIIPHGNFIAEYDNSNNSASARLKFGISNSKFILLFFGRIRPYKGILQLIDTFKTFRQNILDAELIIAGRPLNEQLSNCIRDKIAGSDGIRYIPEFVPQNEIQIYMNASDVLVFPYHEILTSGSAILAMSFARACIAPKLGCIQDILDDNGAFLYNPDETDGLLNALKTAYANREHIPTMGQYNLRIVSPWNWDFVAAETYKVYLKCTND
jgi:beta-1,4-mannosyltransferase